MNSTDENSNHQNAAILDDLVAQTRDLGNSIKSRLQSLEAQPVQPGQDMRIRKNRVSGCSSPDILRVANGYLQTDFARSKFIEALQNYQQVERDYRARYKQRVERQFRIGA